MKEKNVCCICGKTFDGYGNNPYPISKNKDDKCCSKCNYEYVIQARYNMLVK